MCKHILNAQVAIRAQCCRRWFDCAECHAAVSDHPLRKTDEMVFACKKCKKTFRKDMRDYEEEDEFCPHCDNHYVLEAITPEPSLGIETEDLRVDSRVVRDPRQKLANRDPKSIYDLDVTDMMG
ncbi:hypothetical protein BCR43DRAFT_448032 [Syncephalastrum racemosum]|uniref:CHY-type domain-containing protein n=1 Tax=Syncephalastrum racemosum TaxID=13706 RepID=A0A1X2GZI4_SYNRA|nr:hypothetical protein BCR43DRAFT_448032 [Syncephalastrum racemosum]